MPTANHGPSFPTVLYPVHRPRAAGRIKRAVSEVVAQMKPIRSEGIELSENNR